MELKRAVVEQSLQPGVSDSRLAREHGINANKVFAWRKAYQEGRLGTAAFLPVTIAPATAPIIETSTHSVACARLVLERRGARLVMDGQPET